MTVRTTGCRAVLRVLAALVWLAPAAGAWAGPTVAIVKGTDVPKMVAEAIELLGGLKQFVKDGQKVVIKPNLVWQPALDEHGNFVGPRKVRPGLTTDVRIVEALSRQMLQAAKCRITIAEGTPNDLPSLFKFLGYTNLAAELGINLVDVDNAQRMTVRVGGPGGRQYDLPVVTQRCDVLVNVAVMKTHNLAGVTLGMKNLFGLLPEPKSRFHGRLSEVLCDLSLARKCDLVLVDALVATEGQGPLEGTPVRMDLLVAGRDIVAVDAVCTAVMGFEPKRVACLRLAHEKGIGEIDLDRITVKGVPVEKARRPFRHACWNASVEIERNEAILDKLAKMADRVEKSRWGGWRRLLFEARHLEPDTKKYPARRSYGFYVSRWPPSDKIVFQVPYEVLIEENGQAAVDEMAQWIRRKLGKDIRITKHPRMQPP